MHDCAKDFSDQEKSLVRVLENVLLRVKLYLPTEQNSKTFFTRESWWTYLFIF